MLSIPFHITDWNSITPVTHPGEQGFALWKSLQHGDLRIRLVEYSAGYIADHWCSSGHVIYCLNGSMTTELQDGRTFEVRQGMSYEVSDDLSNHRSSTETGVLLLIVDGGFLKRERGIQM